MIDTPGRREEPMKDALLDVIISTPTEPIKKFVERGLKNLRVDAEEIKKLQRREILDQEP